MVIDEIVKRLRQGGKILIAGNGGLAAESEHFAAELVGMYAFDVFVPCIALTSPSSLITALANDIGYERVFSHQVEVWGNAGDIFIGMTTSRSKNILRAIDAADKLGLLTLVLAPEPLGCHFHLPLAGEDVAEKQNHAIVELHKLAYEIKRSLNANSKPE